MPLQALNEFDLRATDWRKKLESQRGAVLAFETKNNLAKIAKWTMCALLAGADMVKLGYVSRAGPKDNSNHVILGTQVRQCLCSSCVLFVFFLREKQPPWLHVGVGLLPWCLLGACVGWVGWDGWGGGGGGK
jgi:hypothetical protein